MPIGLIFWVLMLLWIIARVFTWRGPVGGVYGSYVLIGSDLMVLILLFLLGWHSFGFIVQGGR